MSLLFLALLFNFLGSVISLLGGILLLFKKDFAFKASHYLSSFAAGTLIGAVFFDLLPEAVEIAGKKNIDQIFSFTLFGILFFFVIERFIHWFHHHGVEDHTVKGKPVLPLIIIGDSIHNFIDGAAIAATFAVNVPLGIITTFAVGAHEIPQEIGDFGIMLKHGLSRKKVLLVNILSAFCSILGVFLAFYFASIVEGISVSLIGITSGFFLYISLSDLIPEIHHESRKRLAIAETLMLILGVLLVYFGLSLVKHILGTN